MDKEYKFVSAVIYIHNEQKNIKTYLGLVHKFLRDHFTKYEVICVDDASTDDSVKKIHELVESEKLDNISLVSMSIFHGRELGMEAGVDLSIGDYIYEFEWIDMFNQDTYENLLWEAYSEVIKGYDIVSYGSERYKGLCSLLFYSIYNHSNRSEYEMAPERFRIVTRRAVNRVSRMNKAIVYRKALYSNSGLKVKVIGENRTKKSKKKADVGKNKSKIGTNVLLAYTSIIPRITFLLECILSFIFLCSLINYFGGITNAENGFVILCVSFLALVLCTIGFFVVKYCELLLELVLKKEKYVVSSVEKIVNCEDE